MTFELFKVETIYTNKEGKNKKGYNFYLRTENGYLIAIKNTFKDGYMPLFISAKEYKKG